MMTPEDAKRLVKNRNARDARAQALKDIEEEEKLDYIEEAIALYISETDFVKYVTEEIDRGLEEAINARLPLYVGFWWQYAQRDDICQEAQVSDEYGNDAIDAFAVCFRIADIGIDEASIWQILAETVQALYEDAGWDVSEIMNSRIYPGRASYDDVRRREADPARCFEIRY